MERLKNSLLTLDPITLDITNDSVRHHGHAGDNGSGESHFVIEMTASCFVGKDRLSSHRMVTELIKDEFDTGLHAVTLKLKTPDFL